MCVQNRCIRQNEKQKKVQNKDSVKCIHMMEALFLSAQFQTAGQTCYQCWGQISTPATLFGGGGGGRMHKEVIS